MMITALLLLAAACTATTDIPEVKAGMARTCGEGIKSVSFTGNHKRAKYVITYYDNAPRPGMHSPHRWHLKAMACMNFAIAVNENIQRIYEVETLEVRAVDSKGTFCRHVFGEDETPSVRSGGP